MDFKRIFKIASKIVAMQFSSEQALQKYLHEHPKANKRKHSVKNDCQSLKKHYKKIFENKIKKMNSNDKIKRSKSTYNPDELDVLANDENSDVAYEAINNQNTSSTTLDKVANELTDWYKSQRFKTKWDDVAQAVCWHKNTSLKTLQKLTTSKNNTLSDYAISAYEFRIDRLRERENG